MTCLDSYWTTNDDWICYDDEGEPMIREDAPERAKESYNRFLAQKKAAIERGSL